MARKSIPALVVWYIVRSSDNLKRPPRAYWISAAKITAKRVYLVKTHWGRSVFTIRELADFGLHLSLLGALRQFKERAEHWLDISNRDVERAQLDLSFANARSVYTLSARSKEAPESP